MNKWVKSLALAALVPLCFVVGLYAGPRAVQLYRAWFPPPQFVQGDYASIYARAGKPVVMYATTTCPYCAKARSLFAERGVTYVEYQIDKSKEHDEAFKRLGLPGVPVLFIGDRRIDGYREAAIVEALARLPRGRT